MGFSCILKSSASLGTKGVFIEVLSQSLISSLEPSLAFETWPAQSVRVDPFEERLYRPSRDRTSRAAEACPIRTNHSLVPIWLNRVGMIFSLIVPSGATSRKPQPIGTSAGSIIPGGVTR